MPERTVRAGQTWVSEYGVQSHVLAVYRDFAWVLMPDLKGHEGPHTRPVADFEILTLRYDLSDKAIAQAAATLEAS